MVAKMIRVNYLLLFQRLGQPLYSRCFGDFCQQVSMNEDFLNEFLIMVTKIAKMFVEDVNEVKNAEFGDEVFFFYCLGECDVILTMGVKKSELENGKTMDKGKDLLFSLAMEIQQLINYYFPQFRTNHSILDKELQEFEKRLFFDVLDPWYHRHGGEDVCPLKDRCMVSIRSPFWEELKKIFENAST